MSELTLHEPVELTDAELDLVTGGIANVGLVNADVILNNILNNNDILNNNHVNVAIAALSAVGQRA